MRLWVDKNKFSGMVTEESSGGFFIWYGGFYYGDHCPIPTHSDLFSTSVPTHSGMIFFMRDTYIIWGIFT